MFAVCCFFVFCFGLSAVSCLLWVAHSFSNCVADSLLIAIVAVGCSMFCDLAVCSVVDRCLVFVLLFSRWSFGDYHVLFAVCCLSFVGCCWLFVVSSFLFSCYRSMLDTRQNRTAPANLSIACAFKDPPNQRF